MRLSVLDLVILAIGGVTSFGLKQMEIPFWWLPLWVLGHFFLFCNVFRIARWREFVWAGLAVAGGFGILLLAPERLVLLPLLMLPVTAWAILTEIRSPRYHGVLAKRWNARLSDYLDGKSP